MASGIAISDAFEKTFQGLSKREFSAIVLRINKDMTMVEIEKTVKASNKDPEAEWKTFVKSLPESDCRYIITDFYVKETDTVTKSKIVIIAWAPEEAPVRSKMIYASSRESVSNKATGIQKSIQATEKDELAYAAVKDAIFK